MLLTTLLVWITGILVCLIAVGIGLAFLVPTWRRSSMHTGYSVYRFALWWGLSTITALVLLVNLLLPSKGATSWILGGAFIVVALVGWINARPRLPESRPKPVVLVVGTAIVLVIASLASAFLVLGIPINYDTGLYHLGAIKYANEFATVPGLANLHDRFGFNSSVFPLAGFMDNGIWADHGFRFITGPLFVAASIDLLLRLASRRQSQSAGTVALALGLAAVWSFAILTPGSSLASPNPDIAVALLVVVASAYLLDALDSDTNSRWAGGTAVLVAGLAGTARPVNWVFLVLVLAVTWAVANGRRLNMPVIAGTSLSFLLLIIMLIRDTVLSGWLFYPLSLLPMPVDWRYPTPQVTSDAITAWGRAPHTSLDNSLAGWSWLIPWANRLARDYVVILALAALLVFLVIVVARQAPRTRLYWAVIPSLGVLPIWFITAPDPRFVWGQLLAVGIVPLSVAWSRRASSTIPVLAASGLLATSVLATTQLGSYAVVIKDVQPSPASIVGTKLILELGPVIEAETRPVFLNDGTQTMEVPGDQCWGEFPLCRPSGSTPEVEFRGWDIGAGFRPTG